MVFKIGFNSFPMLPNKGKAILRKLILHFSKNKSCMIAMLSLHYQFEVIHKNLIMAGNLISIYQIIEMGPNEWDENPAEIDSF